MAPSRIESNLGELFEGSLGQDFACGQVPVSAVIEILSLYLETFQFGDGLKNLDAFVCHFGAGTVTTDDGHFENVVAAHGLLSVVEIRGGICSANPRVSRRIQLSGYRPLQRRGPIGDESRILPIPLSVGKPGAAGLMKDPCVGRSFLKSAFAAKLFERK